MENNDAKRRFEMTTPAGTAILDYRIDGTTLYLTHAEVPRAARGSGIAGELTAAALEWAREHGFKVVPLCGYVAAYMHRHKEFSDLLV